MRSRCIFRLRQCCGGFLCAALFVGTARAAVPPLLDEALSRRAADRGHWAFTWTFLTTESKGRPGKKSVIWNDPSLPFLDQRRPLLLEDKPPTEKQLDEYRKAGEARAKRRAQEKPAAPGAYDAHMHLGMYLASGQQALAYYDEASPVSEDATSVTYDVPLHSDKLGAVPIDLWSHFRMLLRVNKRSENFEHVSITMQKPLRLVKVRTADIEVDFGVVDSSFPAVETHIHSVIDVSVLRFKVYVAQDISETDFKRVTPYSDRLGVTIGPLRTIGF